jgi:hypothetical protein
MLRHEAFLDDREAVAVERLDVDQLRALYERGRSFFGS